MRVQRSTTPAKVHIDLTEASFSSYPAALSSDQKLKLSFQAGRSKPRAPNAMAVFGARLLNALAVEQALTPVSSLFHTSIVIPAIPLERCGILRQSLKTLRQPANVRGLRPQCVSNLHEFFKFALRRSDAACGPTFQIIDSRLERVHFPLCLIEPATGKFDFEINAPVSKAFRRRIFIAA